jgi:hypothetical protein
VLCESTVNTRSVNLCHRPQRNQNLYILPLPALIRSKLLIQKKDSRRGLKIDYLDGEGRAGEVLIIQQRIHRAKINKPRPLILSAASCLWLPQPSRLLGVRVWRSTVALLVLGLGGASRRDGGRRGKRHDRRQRRYVWQERRAPATSSLEQHGPVVGPNRPGAAVAAVEGIWAL